MTTPAPSLIKRWAHQDAAFEFVRGLWLAGHHGAMLAMVMGAGKTRVAIDLAVAFSLRLILILCPLRVVEVWRRQFDLYAPGIYTVAALDDQVGTVKQKTVRARDLIDWSRDRSQPVVICTNYESARTDPFAHFALNKPWGLVILDEVHRIKDAAGRTSHWCGRLGLNARYRLGLTGTPMPHEPIDIWGQFRFLDRSILDPTFGSFKLRHAVMGGYLAKQVVGWRDLNELEQRFRSIAFRVDESVLDLPPEMDETLSTSLSDDGARIYREMEEEMITWIKTTEAQGVEVTAANAMVRLLRLQQITGGSLPAEDGRAVTIDRSKERLLADFFEDLEELEPVVVFARFRADLAAIERAASTHDRPYAELSGSRNDLDDWQAGRKNILGVQIQSGGVGIDLSRSRLAVYYSIGYSLGDYLQSRARVRRPPQKRPCAFYHLEVLNSIDAIVLAAVMARQNLIQTVLKELKHK